LEEWSEVFSKPVDEAIIKTVTEDKLQFVGGYLNFSFADSSKKRVNISSEVYFVDSQKNFVKEQASVVVHSSEFTADALDEISNKETVKFEVKEPFISSK
jgi:hypothetical protein